MNTKDELKVIRKLAEEIFGIPFEELDDDDRDYLYDYAFDHYML